jgi:hypothetical protein
MDIASVVRRLDADADVFAALIRSVDSEQACWKPTPDRWSILEVVCHLADEETRDFRTRLDLMLHRPGERWPPIDPEGWAEDEDYLARNLGDEIERFRSERTRSIAWLEGLVDPDWSSTYEHPQVGELRASDLLASWLAHDLIHVRQINRLHRQYLEAVTVPGCGLDYAGRW